MSFNFQKIRSVEFGVCLDTKDGESYRLVPCVSEVQEVLKEMLVATRAALVHADGECQEFSPAEKYAATERLWVDLRSDLVKKHRVVYEAENLASDVHVLKQMNLVVGYFGIFRDAERNKLMAFRRATQFKGILRRKLIRFSDDARSIIKDPVFTLDTDFDFFIADQKICIWRPGGFVFSSDMDEQIAACAMHNVDQISKEISCVDFSLLKTYTSKHKLAMRLVAAIRCRNDLYQTSLKRLKEACRDSGVEFKIRDGKLVPIDGNEMEFLLLLDRRLYTLTLIEKQPETYQASSRSPVSRAAPSHSALKKQTESVETVSKIGI